MLWCIEYANKKVIICRDVFVEDQMPYLDQEKRKESLVSDQFKVKFQNL